MSEENDARKFSLSLPATVFDALAREAEEVRRDAQDHMRWLLIEHALKTDFIPPEEKKMLSLYRDISNRVADMAVEIDETEGFSPDITLRAIQACQKDPNWLADYRLYVGGNEFAEKNARKWSLNQNIGYRVRQALKAGLETSPDGKKRVSKVPGRELIKSFTRLRKLD
ncbi:MAG: hypothetical protein AB7U46_13690 [Paenirhodobacter sp.]|uniref:hypothetical protein n=1 Tax=Paenirhodobacter sp. TaxID=1965326 RepID=UPI003D0EF5FA